MFSILIGLICFALGCIMYLHGVAQESMEQAASLSEQAVFSMSQVSDPADICAQVMEIYKQNPDSKTDPDSYYAGFGAVTDSKDYYFFTIHNYVI